MKMWSFFEWCVKIFTSQVLYSILKETVRESFLLVGGIMLISGTTAWKFVENNYAAHDFKRASYYMEGQTSNVVTIGIDDVAYASYFGGQSPLDRKKLQTLLEVIQKSSHAAKKIVIDLDLAPLAGDNQNDLFGFFSARKDQWVLAEPIRGVADESEATRSWRNRLCDAKIAVGLPYLPTEFGYINTEQQYENSLAFVATRSKNNLCEQFKKTIETRSQTDQEQKIETVPFTTSPSYVKDGLVIPFHGDLQELAATLDIISPLYIVVGGMWGTGDVLLTPLGERYGVQLHAAAIDSALKHERAAPVALNFSVVWLTIASLILLLGTIQEQLFEWIERGDPNLPGHQMLATKLWPLFVLVVCFAWLIGLADAMAFLYAKTGMQINTAVAAASVFAEVLFAWNFGMKELHRQHDVVDTVGAVFLRPVKVDLRSIRISVRHLLERQPKNPAQHSQAAFSKFRYSCELILSIASLLLQTLLPLVTFYFAIAETF